MNVQELTRLKELAAIRLQQLEVYQEGDVRLVTRYNLLDKEPISNKNLENIVKSTLHAIKTEKEYMQRQWVDISTRLEHITDKVSE
jgi:hypothetical protein